MTPDELDRERRVAYLMGILDPMMRELDRIYAPGRFMLWTMLEHRKGVRLLYQADRLLAEIARLRGDEHRPLAPMRQRRMPGHPMFWLLAQWSLGIWNSYHLIGALIDGRYWLAALQLAGLLAALCWPVPPLRLALKGKWHE